MTLIVTEDELTERKETPAVAKILRADNLSLLYQGIITAAVRVRSLMIPAMRAASLPTP